MKTVIDKAKELLEKISPWPWRESGATGTIFDSTNTKIMRKAYKREDNILIASAPEIISSLIKEVELLKSQRNRLWMLLDDIDTAEDMYKPEINGHFEYVNTCHKKRHDVCSITDKEADEAIKVNWPQPTEPEDKG